MLEHEKKLGLIEAASITKGGANATFSLYEASDGFRGTYEEVLQHEKRAEGKVLFSLYEASDGFRGTYDEVVQHEKKVATDQGNDAGESPAGSEVLLRVYESEDGKFRGTYGDVLAYEEKVEDKEARGTSLADAGDVLLRIYESEDRKFRGTYGDVLAYEQKATGEEAGEVGESPLYKTADGELLPGMDLNSCFKFKILESNSLSMVLPRYSREKASADHTRNASLTNRT